MITRKKILVFTYYREHFEHLKRCYSHIQHLVEFAHCKDAHSLRGGLGADAFMWYSKWPDHASEMLDVMMSHNITEIEDPESLIKQHEIS